MLYFSHPACLEHDPTSLMPGHPDTPDRLRAIERLLSELDWLGWERREAPPASEADLELVHSARHVESIRELCRSGGGAIDADTVAGEASYRAALHAAGAACAMTRALLAGEAEAGFCAPSSRPPRRARAGDGLLPLRQRRGRRGAGDPAAWRRACIHPRLGVHHGNGTAEAFRRRPDVLFASIHQGGIFPGTGAREDRGSGPGEGFTINLPVPGGSGGDRWLELLDEVILPAAAGFRPDLVLVSAGYDAHRDDPLADCRLETETYGQMSSCARDMASGLGAPLGAVLEGGYDLGVLAASVAATLASLGPCPR